MNLEEQIREVLRARRLALGLSQAELAKRARVEQRQVSRLETGGPGGNVRLGTLARVLEALGLELDLREAPGAAAPERVVDVRDYPGLKLVAWNRADPRIPEREALALYESQWRHVGRLDRREQAFVRALARRFGHGLLNV